MIIMGPLTRRQKEAFDHGYQYGFMYGYPPATTNLKNYYGKNYIYAITGSETGSKERKEIALKMLLTGGYSDE